MKESKYTRAGRIREMSIDYKTRSGVVVRDEDGRRLYEVICYGLTHSDLATVGGDESPGTAIARRLETRGIPVPMMSIFDTGPIHDKFK